VELLQAVFYSLFGICLGSEVNLDYLKISRFLSSNGILLNLNTMIQNLYQIHLSSTKNLVTERRTGL